MKYFQEITNWADGSDANHIYLLDDSKGKMYAYVPKGSNELFNSNSQSRSTSAGASSSQWPLGGTIKLQKSQKPNNPTWTVAGSKGAEYVVELVDNVYNCTCPGFRFRGACRHIAEVQNNG
jgi:hypothetical protein